MKATTLKLQEKLNYLLPELHFNPALYRACLNTLVNHGTTLTEDKQETNLILNNIEFEPFKTLLFIAEENGFLDEILLHHNSDEQNLLHYLLSKGNLQLAKIILQTLRFNSSLAEQVLESHDDKGMKVKTLLATNELKQEFSDLIVDTYIPKYVAITGQLIGTSFSQSVLINKIASQSMLTADVRTHNFIVAGLLSYKLQQACDDLLFLLEKSPDNKYKDYFLASISNTTYCQTVTPITQSLGVMAITYWAHNPSPMLIGLTSVKQVQEALYTLLHPLLVRSNDTDIVPILDVLKPVLPTAIALVIGLNWLTFDLPILCITANQAINIAQDTSSYTSNKNLVDLGQLITQLVPLGFCITYTPSIIIKGSCTLTAFTKIWQYSDDLAVRYQAFYSLQESNFPYLCNLGLKSEILRPKESWSNSNDDTEYYNQLLFEIFNSQYKKEVTKLHCNHHLINEHLLKEALGINYEVVKLLNYNQSFSSKISFFINKLLRGSYNSYQTQDDEDAFYKAFSLNENSKMLKSWQLAKTLHAAAEDIELCRNENQDTCALMKSTYPENITPHALECINSEIKNNENGDWLYAYKTCSEHFIDYC